MSELELERRRRTGTLSSDTLINMALELLSAGGAAAQNLRRPLVSLGTTRLSHVLTRAVVRALKLLLTFD